MKYNGVDVDHPSIVSTIKKMAEDGKPKSEIVRVVGMPHEVVEKHSRDIKRKK